MVAGNRFAQAPRPERPGPRGSARRGAERFVELRARWQELNREERPVAPAQTGRNAAADLFEQVRQAHAERRDGTAISLCNQILALDPDHHEALVYLAFATQRSGRLDLALPLYERLQRSQPENPTWAQWTVNLRSRLERSKPVAARIDREPAPVKEAVEVATAADESQLIDAFAWVEPRSAPVLSWASFSGEFLQVHWQKLILCLAVLLIVVSSNILAYHIWGPELWSPIGKSALALVYTATFACFGRRPDALGGRSRRPDDADHDAHCRAGQLHARRPDAPAPRLERLQPEPPRLRRHRALPLDPRSCVGPGLETRRRIPLDGSVRSERSECDDRARGWLRLGTHHARAPGPGLPRVGLLAQHPVLRGNRGRTARLRLRRARGADAGFRVRRDSDRFVYSPADAPVLLCRTGDVPGHRVRPHGALSRQGGRRSALGPDGSVRGARARGAGLRARVVAATAAVSDPQR